MSQTKRAYEPSAGAIYGFIGIVLIVLGGFALSNAHEADVFGTIGVGLIAGGSYATIAGAVARGIQLGRAQVATTRTPASAADGLED